DAVHPGYGLLSENEDFARKVSEAGFVFIGPSAENIALMGNKAEARTQLKKAGMPVLPGSDGKLNTIEEALEVAEKVDYPLMIKAVAGGGGRGIAKVESEKELKEQFPRVQSEAQAAFGSDWMYIEKFVPDPRHIEFQVMGDGKGNVIHFYDRECSIQRRHQKLLEEAPSPALSEKNRQKLAGTICSALGKLNYGNAGTVEFVMDDRENAYVIEVNTRIQVEHPVTEMICGEDLIAIQIQTALEGKLPVSQDEISKSGHALEVRVCAEDPAHGFTPQQGTVEHLNFPSGPGCRVDSHLESGSWISPYYDSMIGKIITWNKTRTECIDRMLRCLDETEIEGFKTTIPLFKWLLTDEDFRAADFHTGFLDNKEFKL
ncbi:MAG: acetyl/propionyl/methylcrotonyl-CoA carboxylase subunit alpha, partial [bacterium]